MGRKKPRGNPKNTPEPTLGEPVAAGFRAVRGGDETRGRKDEDEAHAACMDEWYVCGAEMEEKQD